MRLLGFIFLGLAIWVVPVYVIAVVLILMFMRGATRKPTPKRRSR